MAISTVAVIGQGYVGRELSLAAHRVGHEVIGIDNDVARIKDIEEYSVSDNLDYLHTCDIVAVCLPTDVDYYKTTLVEVQRISEFMSPGSLLIIESTVGLGFMSTLRSVISDEIKIAYSPERIDPGNKSFNINNTSKVLSAFDEESYKVAYNFYSSFVENIVKATVAEAEAAKLLENAFRLVNISFINEIAIMFNELGINANNVINLAATKPYGYMPFRPGLGAGGHCIPVDPSFLLAASLNSDTSVDSLHVAFDINSHTVYHYARKIMDALHDLENKKVMVVGMSYKPNTHDTRNSPSVNLINILRHFEVDVVWHDKHVINWNNETSTELTDEVGLAIIVHRHQELNTDEINATHIIDCENL